MGKSEALAKRGSWCRRSARPERTSPALGMQETGLGAQDRLDRLLLLPDDCEGRELVALAAPPACHWPTLRPISTVPAGA